MIPCHRDGRHGTLVLDKTRVVWLIATSPESPGRIKQNFQVTQTCSSSLHSLCAASQMWVRYRSAVIVAPRRNITTKARKVRKRAPSSDVPHLRLWSL